MKSIVIVIKGPVGSGKGLLRDRILIHLDSDGIKAHCISTKESEYSILIEEDIVEKLKKLF